MRQQLKRKRGGQPGNTNNLRSGKWSLRVRAARLEALKERQAADKARSDAWARTVPEIDYGGICEELERLRRAKEAEAAQAGADRQGHHDVRLKPAI